MAIFGVWNKKKEIESSREKFRKINSKKYVEEDYPAFSKPEEIETGTKLNIRQLVRAAKLLPQNGTAFFCSANAVVYQIAALRKKASLVIVTDFDPVAVLTMKLWFEGKPEHDWSAYLKYLLITEGGDGSNKELRQMERELRDLYEQKKIVITTFDIYNPQSLLAKYQQRRFDQVYSIWGIDATTNDETVFWQIAFANLLSKLNKGGLIVMAIVRNATVWEDGVRYYPHVTLTAEKISQQVKKNFGAKKVEFKVHLFDSLGRERWKYDGDDYLFISFNKKFPIIDGQVEDELRGDQDDWSKFSSLT